MKVITTIRIEPELLDAVQVLADKNMRSRNAEICYLLKMALEKPKRGAEKK